MVYPSPDEDMVSPSPDDEWVEFQQRCLWKKWLVDEGGLPLEYGGIVGHSRFGEGFWWQLWREGANGACAQGVEADEDAAIYACELAFLNSDDMRDDELLPF